jgi:histidyl-tRNA synthetase
MKGWKSCVLYVITIEPWVVDSNFDLDVTLARGLNYYTELFEVAPPKEVAMGSIGGGGRYDDLTGILA